MSTTNKPMTKINELISHPTTNYYIKCSNKSAFINGLYVAAIINTRLVYICLKYLPVAYANV